MKKHLLLPILLLVTMLAWSSFGAYLKYVAFEKIGMDTEESIVSLPFVLICDSQMSYRFQYYMDSYMNPTEPTEAPEVPRETQNVPEETKTTEPAVTVSPTEDAQTTTPTEATYAMVEESWFDDVLFIGESRVDGMKINARLGGAEYFSGSNLKVFDIRSASCTDRTFGDIKLDTLLSGRRYGKIFIHLGINECGVEPEVFRAGYEDLIQDIRKRQPDAHIILMSIVPVTVNWSTNAGFLPENLKLFNEQIQDLATGEKMHYMDNNQWAATDEGFLMPDLTVDGCHPHAEGYRRWAQWIWENVAYLEIP